MAAIFVFGSNLSGIHGAGAAKEARDKWGAELFCGEGPKGYSYAIPTKDRNIETLPLKTIKSYVAEFLTHARNNPHDSFMVTAIGCGLAGYSPEQILPMFDGAPENVFLSAKLVNRPDLAGTTWRYSKPERVK